MAPTAQAPCFIWAVRLQAIVNPPRRTASGTNWEIGERVAGKWQIFEDDTDSIVATFQSNGNVGIGQSSPATKLDVNGGLHGDHATFSSVAGRGLKISTESRAVRMMALQCWTLKILKAVMELSPFSRAVLRQRESLHHRFLLGKPLGVLPM